MDGKNPRDKNRSGALRAIDGEILDLMRKRLDEVRRMGAQLDDGALYAALHDTSLMKSILARNGRDFSETALDLIFSEINSACYAKVRRLSAGYLGPQASYTHIASIKHFGAAMCFVPFDSIAEVFAGFETGKIDFGVIPVENTIAGYVSGIIEHFTEADVFIVGEEYLPVRHCLLSRARRPEKIKRIYAHPQAFNQCRKWLDANMKDAERVEASSNSRAAACAAGEKGSAAIAANLAGEVYRLNIIEENIQDSQSNSTRFFVLGREMTELQENAKTTILVSVNDKPGALLDILQIFKDQEINLTKIESHPSNRKVWDYVFFIDLMGHIKDPGISAILEMVRGKAKFIKVLGSYAINGNGTVDG